MSLSTPRLAEIRGGEQPTVEAQREPMNGPVTLASQPDSPAKLHNSESAARNVKYLPDRASTRTTASITKQQCV